MLFRHGARLGALFTLVVAAATGCEDNQQTLFVRGVAGGVHTTPTKCTYSSDSTNGILLSGKMDVALTNTYSAAVVTESQFVKRQDNDNVRAESNRVTITSAELRVTDGVGNELSTFSTLTAQSTIDPQGRNITFSTLIGDDIGSCLNGSKKTGCRVPKLVPGQQFTLVTYIKFFGKTIGGVEVETTPFQFIVSACRTGRDAQGVLRSCLVDFSQGTDATIAKQPNCDLAEKPGDPPQCVLGQDEPLDCRYCRGTSSACDPSL